MSDNNPKENSSLQGQRDLLDLAATYSDLKRPPKPLSKRKKKALREPESESAFLDLRNIRPLALTFFAFPFFILAAIIAPSKQKVHRPHIAEPEEISRQMTAYRNSPKAVASVKNVAPQVAAGLPKARETQEYMPPRDAVEGDPFDYIQSLIADQQERREESFDPEVEEKEENLERFEAEHKRLAAYFSYSRETSSSVSETPASSAASTSTDIPQLLPTITAGYVTPLQPIQLFSPTPYEASAMTDAQREAYTEQYQRTLDEYHKSLESKFGSDLPTVTIGNLNQNPPEVDTE